MAENSTLSESELEMIDVIIFKILPFVIYGTVAGCVLEAAVLIAFCYFIFANKLANLKGLLILYSIGYFLDILQVICWVMSWLSNWESYFWLQAAEMSYDYCELSGSVWNTLLALNRITALKWPLKYSKVWSFRNICLFALPTIFMSPFVILGFVLFDERFYQEGL